MNFKDIFEKLYPSYMNKLWKYTFQNFTSYYMQFIIFQSSKYSPKDSPKMVAKVKEEIDIMAGFFKAVVPSKDADNLSGHLNDLYGAFVNSPEDTIVNIVSLKIFLKKDFSDKSMVGRLHQNLIMRMRTDIQDELKSKIKELIDKENQKLALIEKKQMFKLMTKNLLTEFTIRRFTEKFRLRFQEKQEQRAKIQNDRHNEDILKINENERLDIEQEAMQLIVMMDYFKVAVQNEKNLNVHLNSIKSAKTKLAKFSFIDDILLVHDDQQNLLEKIFLVSIKDVLCYEQLHIYMVAAAHRDLRNQLHAHHEVHVFRGAQKMDQLHPLPARRIAQRTQADRVPEVQLRGEGAVLRRDFPLRPARLHLQQDADPEPEAEEESEEVRHRRDRAQARRSARLTQK